MAKVTYTFWQHFSRDSEEEDSMVDALRRAESDVDYNLAAPESIATASGKVLDLDEIGRYQKRHKVLVRQGTQRERARIVALQSETSRPITWREARAIIRRLNWHPLLARIAGHGVLCGSVGNRTIRIASFSDLRTMSPAAFWQRLRHLDPYQVATIER